MVKMRNKQKMTSEEMKDRTKQFAKQIQELKLCQENLVPSLMEEGNEILSIVVSSINTARKNR
jgi:hypothetical protein